MNLPTYANLSTLIGQVKVCRLSQGLLFRSSGSVRWRVINHLPAHGAYEKREVSDPCDLFITLYQLHIVHATYRWV